MKRIFIISLVISSQLFAAPPQRLSSFDQGKRQYESGNYSRALDLFAEAIDKSGDSGTRNKSYYYQGLVLFELGLYYSSYLSFRNVLLAADDKSREVYEKAIKNAVIITDKLNMVDKVGKVIEKLPNHLIPASVAGLAHYSIGVNELQNGSPESAMSRLKSVPPENQFYDKALFYLGVLATKQKNYKEAIYYFDKVVDQSRGMREKYSLQELARLNLARSLYSAGEVEKSIETYSQFLSSSPHWLTVLLEASWPLTKANDTTVSLGNLHTITSPFYREDLVGEGYILRATILFSLCKYEEMRRTLSHFFSLYDPILRAMQSETSSMGSPEAYYRAYATGKGLNRAFNNYIRRDDGIAKNMKVLDLLKIERRNLAKFNRNEQIKRLSTLTEEAEASLAQSIGQTIQALHRRKLQELVEQREQANYLKVEIVTGEKELIEGQKGLPPKRIVDVETSVASGYHFWPFSGEYWEDELGTYVYTTESSCVN